MGSGVAGGYAGDSRATPHRWSLSSRGASGEINPDGTGDNNAQTYDRRCCGARVRYRLLRHRWRGYEQRLVIVEARRDQTVQARRDQTVQARRDQTGGRESLQHARIAVASAAKSYRQGIPEDRRGLTGSRTPTIRRAISEKHAVLHDHHRKARCRLRDSGAWHPRLQPRYA